MVHLTITPALRSALQSYSALHPLSTLSPHASDPILTPATPLHSPITHSQILAIFKALKSHDPTTHPRLPDLLRGAKVHVEPPKPAPPKSSEYTALMARLRAEAEAREYERMTAARRGPGVWGGGGVKGGGRNPLSKWAAPSEAAAWDLDGDAAEDEEVSMREINAQLSLVVNVIVSILACGVTVFLLLRWSPLSEGVRVLVSMAAGGLVGVAEVVIYSGFVRRTGEAKMKERGKKEERTVQETWVIEGRLNKEKEALRMGNEGSQEADTMRRRRGKVK